MIKFINGVPLEPITRSELYAEIVRLYGILTDTKSMLKRQLPAEADVLTLAVNRTNDETI